MNSIKNNSKELKNKKTLEPINSLFDPYKITSVPGIERTFIIKDHKANVNLLTSILIRLKSKDATQNSFKGIREEGTSYDSKDRNKKRGRSY